ncbi:MAG: S8 family serine peptidase, partial [Chloroflexi bacterium]|nr:S8 family serine peptidase [Chloroflexota bacterium]
MKHRKHLHIGRRASFGLAVALMGLALSLINGAALAQTDLDNLGPHIDQAIITELEAQYTVGVIIDLADPAAVGLRAPSADRATMIRNAQDSVLNAVSTARGIFHMGHRYSQVPAMSARVDSQMLALLSQHPDVRSVTFDYPIESPSAEVGLAAAPNAARDGAFAPRMVQAQDVINSDDVFNLGITGAGARVAIIDTGYRRDHPDLINSVIAERCFTGAGGTDPQNPPSCLPNDTATSDNAGDEFGHGTGIAGIITGDGTTQAPRGIAPDTGIIPIRVLNEAGEGVNSDRVAAIDWILANQASLQVDIINMSLGTKLPYAFVCDGAIPASSTALSAAFNAGITLISSTGNQGLNNSTSEPACHSNVIAVSATWDSAYVPPNDAQPSSGSRFPPLIPSLPPNPNYSDIPGFTIFPDCFDATTAIDVVPCFTNMASFMDLFAPGAIITTTGADLGQGDTDNSGSFIGSSQAAALVSGVTAQLLQADPSLTPTQIRDT